MEEKNIFQDCATCNFRHFFPWVMPGKFWPTPCGINYTEDLAENENFLPSWQNFFSNSQRDRFKMFWAVFFQISTIHILNCASSVQAHTFVHRSTHPHVERTWMIKKTYCTLKLYDLVWSFHSKGYFRKSAKRIIGPFVYLPKRCCQEKKSDLSSIPRSC